MKFVSTNHRSPAVGLKEAVLNGLAPDGGLYMPEALPRIPLFADTDSFQEIAFELSKRWIENDIPERDIRTIVESALNFDAPLRRLSDSLFVLELFHGPTLAFKDFGARFMARLMGYFLKDSDRDLTILVATSGDTGSAVAHGFFNVPGIRVVILYPRGGVSEIQEKQLTTLGGNVTALEVDGVFDDCQRLVKEAFMDKELRKKRALSSANSINIARLIPQSFYYCYAVSQLRSSEGADPHPRIQDQIVFSVPSGNFGNLTAGLFAKKMGLPVAKFVASTNLNDVVPQYLKTGRFEPRPSRKTISNAMDVGNPSNFARMQALYQGDLAALRADIRGYSFSDVETREAIQEVYKTYGVILDPHTAVAHLGMKEYLETTIRPHEGGSFGATIRSPERGPFRATIRTTGILLQTAHPAKFLDVVEPVIGQKIPIPESLERCMATQKKSIPLSNRYEDLKERLM
ncbi:threonine synthase [Candidatus Peregrinibacteria bacterium]|nr:threonine synthase [Candidatus Peregrinibacteria bacterium]